MAHRHGHGRPNVAYRALERLGAVDRVRRDPDHVPRLLRPLAERGAQAVRALRGPLTVVHVHELLPTRLVEGRGADVGVRELVRLGAGSQPHLCDVEVEGLARRGEEGFDGGHGGGEEAGVILLLERFVVLGSPPSRHRRRLTGLLRGGGGGGGGGGRDKFGRGVGRAGGRRRGVIPRGQAVVPLHFLLKVMMVLLLRVPMKRGHVVPPGPRHVVREAFHAGALAEPPQRRRHRRRRRRRRRAGNAGRRRPRHGRTLRGQVRRRLSPHHARAAFGKYRRIVR